MARKPQRDTRMPRATAMPRGPQIPQALPQRIVHQGARYRLAQEEEAFESDKPGDFSFKDFQLGEGAAAMAKMMVSGLAAKLIQDGITKDQIKRAKINDAASSFTSWVKAVVAERAAFKAELRLLQRYGPEQYLQKKAQQLKQVKS